MSDDNTEGWSCNIKKRGRILRVILGAIAIATAILFLWKDDTYFWAIGLIVLGGFAVLEGIVGWCALRALGIKTPL